MASTLGPVWYLQHSAAWKSNKISRAIWVWFGHACIVAADAHEEPYEVRYVQVRTYAFMDSIVLFLYIVGGLGCGNDPAKQYIYTLK